MAKLSLLAGTTSKLIDVFIQDTSVTTGAGLTGLTNGSGSLTWYYYREGAASSVQVTAIASMTLGTWTSKGFIVVDGTNMPGVYQLGVPDAALAAGAKSVVMMLKGATNMAPVVIEIELTAVDNQTANLTAAQIATGIWQDATSGDFTVSSSIGKSLYTSGNAPGAASGIALVGSNMGSITGALTAAQIATGVWQDSTAGDFTTSASIGKSVMNGVALGTGLTVNDLTTKTGFSLSQTFPTNFSALGIGAGGHITTVDTVTTVTNQLTAAAIATGVWTDTTAGDFTTSLSIGKSIMNGVTLGTGLTIAAVSGNVTFGNTSIGTVTNLTNLPSIPANWLTAAGIASGALDAAWSTAARTLTAGTNIQLPSNGLANVTAWTVAITGNITGNLSGAVGSVTTVSDKTGYALTTLERTAIANEVEAQIIDETDSEKVLTAITDKIASVNPDLSGLTLSAISSSVWSAGTRILTAGTNIALAKGTGVTGFNDLSTSQVNAEVDTALADYDGPTHTEMTAELATADDATLAAISSLDAKFIFSVAGYADVNIRYVNSVQVNGDGSGTPWGP